MPFCYTGSLATAGNTATHATPNTETEVFFIKAGSTRSTGLYAIDVGGKGAGLTSLSGIGFRLIRWATAATSGTSLTPQPHDPGAQAYTGTAASAPTAGTTRTNRAVFTCGATSPGGWWAKTPDSMHVLPAGNAASYDLLSISGTASLNFEFSFEVAEG